MLFNYTPQMYRLMLTRVCNLQKIPYIQANKKKRTHSIFKACLFISTIVNSELLLFFISIYETGRFFLSHYKNVVEYKLLEKFIQNDDDKAIY